MRLIAVPKWIMEKIRISYEGNVKVHPSVFLALAFDRAHRDLETAFAQHFHKLGRRCGLVVLVNPLFYGTQHFSGELKRPTTPYTYVVNCREFYK